MALAENIKAKRIAKKMSQEELSGLVGVSRMAICYYENGERVPDLYTGVKIAQALGTTAEKLISNQNLRKNVNNQKG